MSCSSSCVDTTLSEQRTTFSKSQGEEGGRLLGPSSEVKTCKWEECVLDTKLLHSTDRKIGISQTEISVIIIYYLSPTMLINSIL